MLAVGSTAVLHGDVTTLNWVGPRPPADVEKNLGYHAGRLSRGYWLAMLIVRPDPDQFEFSGTTLRSGGRLGLPAQTKADDEKRTRVRDDIQSGMSAADYRTWKEKEAEKAHLHGSHRLCKVVPVSGHDDAMPPADQYPMGGGGLQWTINRPGLKFFVAASFQQDLSVATPYFTVSLDPRQRGDVLYENRARLRRFFEIAPARPPR